MALSKEVEEEALNRLWDQLNGFYNSGRPREEFIDYFREDNAPKNPQYLRFRNFLYGLFDEKQDLSSMLRGMSKEDFIMRCRFKNNWKLDTILDMGKEAQHGNMVAEKDLEFWHNAIQHGTIYGDRILRRYDRALHAYSRGY